MLAPLLRAYAATTLLFEDFSSVITPGSCIGGSLASMEVRGGVRLRLPSQGSLSFTTPYVELVGGPANVRGPAVGKTGSVLQPGNLDTVSFLAFGDLGRSSSSDALFVDVWPSFAFPTTRLPRCTGGVFCPAEHGTMPPAPFDISARFHHDPATKRAARRGERLDRGFRANGFRILDRFLLVRRRVGRDHRPGQVHGGRRAGHAARWRWWHAAQRHATVSAARYRHSRARDLGNADCRLRPRRPRSGAAAARSRHGPIAAGAPGPDCMGRQCRYGGSFRQGRPECPR